MSSPIPGRATVLVATVNSGKWFQSGAHRFDFVLDVRPSDGSGNFRAELLNQRVYHDTPAIGIDVGVEIDSATRAVTLKWRGDPNLDLDAWRDQRKDRDQAARDAAMRGEDPTSH
jgi:hypothetical protein